MRNMTTVVENQMCHKECKFCGRYVVEYDFVSKHFCRFCVRLREFKDIQKKRKRFNRVQTQRVKRWYNKEKVIRAKKSKKVVKNGPVLGTIIKRKRAELLKIRPHECQKCKIKINVAKMIHMHHVDKDRENNNDDNLLLLCPECHQKQHKNNKWITKLMEGQVKEWAKYKNRYPL